MKKKIGAKFKKCLEGGLITESTAMSDLGLLDQPVGDLATHLIHPATSQPTSDSIGRIANQPVVQPASRLASLPAGQPVSQPASQGVSGSVSELGFQPMEPAFIVTYKSIA